MISSTSSSEVAELSNILKPDPSLEYHLVASAGYITDRNPQLATIISPDQDKISIYQNDLVYLDHGARNNIEFGGMYVIYRLENEVINPNTTAILGRILKIMGFVKILSLEDNRATGVITHFYDIIYRGDKIGAIDDLLPSWHYSVLPIPKDRRVKGLIVGSQDSRVMLGQYDIVYINLGRDHGIGPGARFRILRPLGHHSAMDFKIALEGEIGELEVISSQNSTATAIIKRIREEIFLGEVIELKASGKISRALYE